jgi:glutathione S-transferase
MAEGGSMLKILGRRTSINVRKALWTADELVLAYEVELWGLPHRDPNAPDFLALNPNAQVPVLRDGDFVLWESAAIMRYLMDAYGPGDLMPGDPFTRALAEQWFAWQSTDLNGSWVYAVMALVRKLPGHDDAKRIGASLKAWTAKMRMLEARLAQTKAYVAGDAFSFADISMGLSVHRWFGGEFERPDLPAVAAYYERVKERPGARVHFDAATP